MVQNYADDIARGAKKVWNRLAKEMVSEAVPKVQAVGKLLHSNMKINDAADSIHIAKGALSGLTATYHNVTKAGMGIKDAASVAHRTAQGNLNLAAIAGSYIGVSAAARIASGGGIYRDRHGETDLIGIPFI